MPPKFSINQSKRIRKVKKTLCVNWRTDCYMVVRVQCLGLYELRVIELRVLEFGVWGPLVFWYVGPLVLGCGLWKVTSTAKNSIWSF